MNLVGFGTIPAHEIKINEYELSKRLSTEKGFRSDLIEENLKRVLDAAEPKFCYARFPVLRFEDGVLNCGFGKIRSESLLKNLKDCQEVFVFAVTLGIKVDRLLSRLSAISVSDHFVADGIASALAEAAANDAEKRIKGEKLSRPRFSPGFGDLSLDVQGRLLESINAQKILGIAVGKSYLMTPMKSVTAIMGIV